MIFVKRTGRNRLLSIDLKLQTTVSEKDVLELLNSTPEDRIASSLWSGDAFYETNSAAVHPDLEVDKFCKQQRTDREVAAQKVCICIDEWIDGGKNGTKETACNRHESRAQQAMLEAATYWKTSRTILETSTLPTLRLLPQDQSNFENPMWQARRIIALVLSGDLRLRIAKCRYKNCERYFVFDKPNKTYEYGIFCCIKHNRSATVPIRVQERRRKFEDKLIAWAAKYVREHATPDWQANVIFKEKLAKHLTSLIAKERAPTRDNVTKNWVTRNAAHIQAKKSTKQSLYSRLHKIML
jgi:hypothetical protein